MELTGSPGFAILEDPRSSDREESEYEPINHNTFVALPPIQIACFRERWLYLASGHDAAPTMAKPDVWFIKGGKRGQITVENINVHST